MRFTDVIPYYSDLQIARLLACSYVAGALSLAAVFLVSRLLQFKLGFDQVAAFCFIASGALWLMPLISHIPDRYVNYFLLGTLFLFLPLAKVIYELPWAKTFMFWAVFAAAQLSLYFYMINS